MRTTELSVEHETAGATRYRIALPAGLGVSSADFATAWNNIHECRTVARARLGHRAGIRYDPTARVLPVLGNVDSNTGPRVIYDLVRRVLVDKGIHRATQILRVDQKQSAVLVVRVMDE
jgi:hypothetical protein